MAVKIQSIQENSSAHRAGILPGEILVAINGHEIYDVLDYRFYETNQHLELSLHNEKGEGRTVSIRKRQYDSIGLEFSSYLMDEKHTCRNKCVFCFIDQMPKGMRDTLYFKDDDERLSFLFGNYVTLTNLTEREVERMIEMKISPINISVHTTNPELRVKMMGNRFAGRVLDILPRLAEAGIRINCQCVLCPEINDGEELRRTLSDLEELMPALESVSLVPVGITKYREGLTKLRPYTKEEAAATIDLIDSFGDRFVQEYGARTVYAADEFYLKAERPIPPPAFYEEFSQLESGVGSLACLQEEFGLAWEDAVEYGEVPEFPQPRTVTLATGMAACDFIRGLLDDIGKTCHNLTCQVIGIRNDFFGETITVAGLVTGTDLIAQLKGKPLGDTLLIPSVMLRHQGDVFLDDISIEEVSRALQVPVVAVNNDGQQLLDAVFGRDLFCQNQS
ncbi:MAG: DUF512 domain-containing protein [Clostridiales bacterium]|nr:DUF512 domain-containing protein [Clostridiales bacterium]